jgi:mannose-1-phosphate guanylyltransferase
VPAAPFELDVNRDVYPPLMPDGLVRAHVVDGYWNDLGTPERYLAANLDVLAGRVPLARFGLDPLAGAVRRDGAALHPSARVEPGAGVERSYVAAGARLGAGSVVRDAVVWAGTEVGAGERVERAIAAGTLRVAAGGAV